MIGWYGCAMLCHPEHPALSKDVKTVW
jgi:hypothetical protein